ncbi:MAG: ABC transporter permease [Gaiellales bacterium]|nr:MAG: ABC transporter permease [Gaiellales bacterium]
MRAIRNIFRRKLRATLTIGGIAIGVLALVVMGAIAEKMTLLVNGGTEYFSDKVTVSESPAHSMAALPMSIDRVAEMEAVDGVNVASAGCTLLLDEDGGASFGMPAMLIGYDLRARDLESFEVTFADGRDLEPGDQGKAVIGSDLVKKLGVEKAGDTIEVRGRTFEVVGIMEATLTAPDTTVLVNLPDAQEIFYDGLPEFVQSMVTQDEVITDLTIYPDEGVDPDQLADRLEAQFDDIDAIGPEKFEEQIGSIADIFNYIVYGVAMVSLVVGGLSVINTMTMSVYERTREIGIRKALGASDWRIIRQFLTESAWIGLIGGIIGLALGSLMTAGGNNAIEQSGTAIFLLTPRLAIGSLAFAVVLGVLSGLYPAWHAARMNPVEALRYE